MYLPKPFEQADIAKLVDRIRAAPLGTLVINGPGGIEVNHLPFVYRAAGAGPGELQAHVPRANPLFGMLGAAAACVVIFHGPQGYISPSWYATKSTHGKVVPTWNYAVTHVHGQVRAIDDPRWVAAQLQELTHQNERQRPAPWSISDAPESYVQSQLRHLVGLEVSIERMVGKIKASQNQPGENRASVLAALDREQPGSSLSRWMHEVLEPGRSQ